MVRGMVTPFKMPIFYDFDVDADLALVEDMIAEVEAVGGRVRAVVCDMGNGKFLGKDGVKLYQKGYHSLPNPARPDDKVWVIPDPVHMIKVILLLLSLFSILDFFCSSCVMRSGEREEWCTMTGMEMSKSVRETSGSC